jgi:hypothetical protein
MDLKSLIEGNSTVQVFVASERSKQALHLVSPEAREAVAQEIAPQIEELITSEATLDALEFDLLNQIQDGFKTKNPTYTRLLRYKSIDQSDLQFMDDLMKAFKEWSRQVRVLLSEGKTPQEDKTQEVKVKVKVEGADSVESVSETPEEDLELGIESPFDLNEVRV